jgi:glyoxylase-like metal-dependent hydrolase (beta-lactamase superfamily II)
VRIEGSTAVHEFERTLQKLALLDVAVVYPGHGQPFTDFKEALKRSRRKIQGYLLDREKIGNDLLKKIVVYTLLMKQSVPEDLFYQQLRETMWYKETVDLYFNGEYEAKYKEILHRFIERGVVKRKDDHLVTTVKA